MEGKIIINTGPTGSPDLIGENLQRLGVIVLSLPMIEIIQSKISSRNLQNIIDGKTYQWLIFTSSKGVDNFFKQLKSAHTEISDYPFKTAVFGKRTYMALQDHGLKPKVTNFGNTAVDLLKNLYPILQSGDKVLLVLGDLASPLLEESLKSKVKVDRLNVYRTVFVQAVDTHILHRIVKGDYDLILFTSPSGFRSFMHHTTGVMDLSKLKIACLGPTTEEALRTEGLKPLVVAKPSGKEGLIKGIDNFFATTRLKEIRLMEANKPE